MVPVYYRTLFLSSLPQCTAEKLSAFKLANFIQSFQQRAWGESMYVLSNNTKVHSFSFVFSAACRVQTSLFRSGRSGFRWWNKWCGGSAIYKCLELYGLAIDVCPMTQASMLTVLEKGTVYVVLFKVSPSQLEVPQHMWLQVGCVLHRISSP